MAHESSDHCIPGTDNTYALGTDAARWAEVVAARDRVVSGTPAIYLEETDAPANNTIWRWLVESQTTRLQLGNDAKSSFDSILAFVRSANVCASMTITALRSIFSNCHIESLQNTAPTTDLTSTTLNDGAGSGAAIAVTAGSSDNAGSIQITAGNGTPGAGIAGQIVFNFAYASAPKSVILMPKDADAVDLQPYISSVSTTEFQISLNAAMDADEVAEWYYWVIG